MEVTAGRKKGLSTATIRRSLIGSIALTAWFRVAPSFASDATVAPSSLAGVELHGFVSQGFFATTANNYLGNSERGTFELTEVGLNITDVLRDDFRVGMQVFARDLGPIGNYTPKFDWFYLDYRFRDWLGIRAGRTKLPFGLYNDTSDIDAARVPVLLPSSVYPTQNRDFLLAQTGGELYGYVGLGALGALDYRLYGGTVFFDAEGSSVVGDVEVPYVVGGRGMWQTPVVGLQLGGSLQALRLEALYALDAATLGGLEAAGKLPVGFDGNVRINIPAVLAVASVEYVTGDLLLAAEYSRWYVEATYQPAGLFPDVSSVSERMYGMASYHVAPWFTPGVYYSVLHPDVDQKDGRDAYQHDLALTFRYDINANWLLKLEAHAMRGTADLDPSLNDGMPRSSLTKDWALALIKTTAYF